MYSKLANTLPEMSQEQLQKYLVFLESLRVTQLKQADAEQAAGIPSMDTLSEYDGTMQMINTVETEMLSHSGTLRQRTIRQLRTAIDLVESPQTDVAEFDIGETEFCFEFPEGE